MTLRFRISEAAARVGVHEQVIIRFVEAHWLMPEHSPDLDEQDLARCRLIYELQHDLGVNDEAVPIILGLIDHIHSLEQMIIEKQREKRRAG